MRRGQLWPLDGENDEVVYRFTDNRRHTHAREILGSRYKGALLPDGCESQCRRHDPVPTNLLSKALKHAVARKGPLQVFVRSGRGD